MKNEKLRNFAKKIILQNDINADIQFKQDAGIIPAKVVIELRNGEKYTNTVQIPWGDPRNPISKDKLIEKFKSLTLKNISCKNKVDHVIDVLLNLENLDKVSEIIHYIS